MLKYAILFASILISAVHGNQPCLGAPTDRVNFVASPESCSAYIICMNGQTIRGESCPQGLMFNAVNQICSSSSCTDCSPFGIQNLPVPRICNQYIECRMGFRTFRHCPVGFLFNRQTGFCDFSEIVDCVDDPSVPTEPTTTVSDELPSCTADGIFHPDPTSCSHFFVCVNFNLWPQECAPGLHWNRNLQRCTSPLEAQCPIA